jgi:hypothetical protein
MSSTHRHLLLDFFWQVISGPPCILITMTDKSFAPQWFFDFDTAYIQGGIEMRGQILTTSHWLHVELGKNI